MSSLIDGWDKESGKEMTGGVSGCMGSELLPALATEDIPRISTREIPAYTCAFLIFAMAVIMVGRYGGERIEFLQLVGALLVPCSIVVFILEGLGRRRKVERSMESARPLVQEVKNVLRALTGYLTELDRRTSKYFHCVTNTKVTTYFMLRQIENSLSALVEELEEALAHPSADNFLMVHERLRGTIEYRDGFEFNSGKIYYLPITRLSLAIQDLIQNLEAGIQALEGEIQFCNRQMQNSAQDKQLTLPLADSDKKPANPN